MTDMRASISKMLKNKERAKVKFERTIKSWNDLKQFAVVYKITQHYNKTFKENDGWDYSWFFSLFWRKFGEQMARARNIKKGDVVEYLDEKTCEYKKGILISPKEFALVSVDGNGKEISWCYIKTKE